MRNFADIHLAFPVHSRGVNLFLRDRLISCVNTITPWCDGIFSSCYCLAKRRLTIPTIACKINIVTKISAYL